MTYRLKHRHEIVWLAEPLTIVTEWKRHWRTGKKVPAKHTTYSAGTALVITHLPGGKQQQRFASRAEVAEHFEEEMPPEPEHVQGETTNVPFPSPWWQWMPPAAQGTITFRSPLDPSCTITNETATHPTSLGVYRSSSTAFYLDPPEAPKAV